MGNKSEPHDFWRDYHNFGKPVGDYICSASTITDINADREQIVAEKKMHRDQGIDKML